jgi:hypothetical protein
LGERELVAHITLGKVPVPAHPETAVEKPRDAGAWQVTSNSRSSAARVAAPDIHHAGRQRGGRRLEPPGFAA